MKVYKLKKGVKYSVPKDRSLRAVHNFRMYVNKRNFQQRYGRSYKCYNRYKRPSILWLVVFYYGFIAVILLFKKLGL